MKKRKYTQKRRAVQQEQTREKIVEAAMHLHERIGPRNTTISAIADQAGVQRLTVYRHFADESAIYQACSSRWLEIHPPPDPQQWLNIEDAAEHTRSALRSLYGYYRDQSPMLSAVHRDEEAVPAMQSAMQAFRAYQDTIRDQLVEAWQPAGAQRRALKALIGHALRFPAWQSLQREQLKDAEMARLMTRCIASLL